jgi:predicted transposase YdaD
MFHEETVHEYDSTLKLLLQASAPETLLALTGTVAKRWLNVELPKIQNLRIDLLGETADDGLIHIEIQSTNDDQMALHMAEYCLAIYRRHGRFAHQVVLYVGNRKLSMAAELRGPAGHFRYDLVDLRALDNTSLMASRAVRGATM